MANKFTEYGKKATKATFKGEEGSFFWLCEWIWHQFKEVIDALNDFLGGRRAQREFQKNNVIDGEVINER